MIGVYNFLNKFNYLLSKKDRIVIIFLIGFSIIVSLFEIVGITAILPYITLLSNPEAIQEKSFYIYLCRYFNFSTLNQVILIFSFLLIIVFLLKVLLVTFFNYKVYNFSAQKYSDIGISLYKVYLRKRYCEFLTYNSALLSKSIVLEARYISHIISSLLTVTAEVLITIFIFAVLLYINFKLTLLLILFLVFKVFILVRPITKKLKSMGGIRDEIEVNYYKIANETFGNYKSIKLLQNYDRMEGKVLDTSLDYKNIISKYMTLMQLPKLLLEATALVTVVLIVLYSIYIAPSNDIIPLVTMYAVAFYRLLPSVNKVVSGINQVVFYTKSLNLVYDELNTDYEKISTCSIKFHKQIRLENVGFNYNETNNVLVNINLGIQKRTKLAFVGDSGSGKSTLVDIIMGFHYPCSGRMYVDETLVSEENLTSWRKKIGYIPQNIYLFDGSISDNIVFGREFNHEQLVDVLQKVNLWGFVQSKSGIVTSVGESGLALSGGQKQRIAIARALYGNPEILVLDEATSALDDKTESKIMEEIYKVSEDLTLIIIAHRLSTIKQCEIIYKLDNGKLVKTDFDSLITKKKL